MLERPLHALGGQLILSGKIVHGVAGAADFAPHSPQEFFALLLLLGGVLIVGVALLLSALPGVASRLNQRWVMTTATVGLVAILIAMSLLGYLEGQLKAT